MSVQSSRPVVMPVIRSDTKDGGSDRSPTRIHGVKISWLFGRSQRAYRSIGTSG